MQRIFVGDIQGCADELEELLERATHRFGSRFELWPAGDLVNRGPGSRRVLERIHGLFEQGRAFPVLGNHDLALLRTALGLRRPAPLDSFSDVLDGPDAGHWVEWLRRLPLARAGQLAGDPFLMVHAAAFPASLEHNLARAAAAEERLRQPDAGALRRFLSEPLRGPDASPESDALGRLVSCRSVGADGSWSDAEPGPGSEAWHAAWQRSAPDYGVVYGHWSMQGLHVAPGLRGLDTGCVHHGRGRDGFLTAWLPDDRAPAFGARDARFWQIRAHRRYIAA